MIEANKARAARRGWTRPYRARYALFSAAVWLLAGAAQAASTDRITATVDPAVRSVLAGQRARWARTEADRGAVPATLELSRLSLALKRSPERQQAFEQYLRDQQDPTSPDYQHWLSPTEIGERFGVSQHDLDALSAWLDTQGLMVDTIANSRTRISFSGSASAVAAAFATDLHYYQAGAQKRIANTSAPSIPAAFSGVVGSVVGLSSITLRPLLHAGAPRSSPASAKSSPQPASTNCNGATCTYSVFPADFATIYDLNPVSAQGIDGSGQTIAIVARARVNNADIKNFQTLTGLATKYPRVTIPPTGTDPGPAATSCSTTGTPSCTHPSDQVMDQSEATLDVQRAGSVAPGATVNLIASADTNSVDGVFVAMDYAIDTTPVPAKILSISYATCEADNSAAAASALDDYFSQAAMEGISVFVASGDGGVAGCASLDAAPVAGEVVSTNLLCSSSHVTCVGGTEFADTADPGQYWSANNGAHYGSAFGYIPEGAWNEPLDSSGKPQMAATGGGVSVYIPTPSWQVGPGVPGTQGRYTPDVSFNASTREGYFTCFAAQNASCVVSQGSFSYLPVGGTSASAPSMAGIAALLNQKTGSAQANLNPRLYALAGNPANGVFHDVTKASSGVGNCSLATPSPCNNSTPGPNGLSGGLQGYTVGSGYDLATGLGSLDVARLLAYWNGPGTTSVNLDQHALTGAWYNPPTAGQGLLLEIGQDSAGRGNGTLFGGWFTYDTSAAGGTRWYTLQGPLSATNASTTVPIYLTQGGRFDTTTSTQTSVVGQATLEFSDCTHGTLAYSFSDGSNRGGIIPLTRLTANVNCTQAGGTASAGRAGLGGTWYEPATAGQGLLFDVNPVQNVLFAAWYTYGASAGASSGAAGQRWYTIQGPLPAGSAAGSYTIYATSGGVFNQPVATQTAAVGTASLTFQSCTAATLNYRFDAGENNGRSGSIALTRLLASPPGCTP